MATKIITGGGPQGDGVQVGGATTEKVGFYGATPIVQRAGAAQAAVATDLADDANGAAIAAAVNATAALANELRASLVAAGLIKGAA